MDSPIVNASVSGMTKDAAILVNPAGNASSYTASVGSQKSNDPQQKVGAVNAEQVQKSIQKLQEKVAQSKSSFKLEAGLDPNGDHPNQVLIKLSDITTKQVLFSYYVPADQISKAAESSSPLGNLLQQKS